MNLIRPSRLPLRCDPMLTAIAIVARNGVIGDGKDQPFTFREDWRRFKARTLGHPLIMGRRTYESIGCLPGRLSIVLTRSPHKLNFCHGEQGEPCGYAVDSLEAALAKAGEAAENVFVIGGGEIYRLAWDLLDELDLTEVHADAEGSVSFPVVDPGEWLEFEREPRGEFDFVRYRRR